MLIFPPHFNTIYHVDGDEFTKSSSPLNVDFIAKITLATESVGAFARGGIAHVIQFKMIYPDRSTYENWYFGDEIQRNNFYTRILADNLDGLKKGRPLAMVERKI